jgi:hypothetical protein
MVDFVYGNLGTISDRGTAEQVLSIGDHMVNTDLVPVDWYGIVKDATNVLWLLA